MAGIIPQSTNKMRKNAEMAGLSIIAATVPALCSLHPLLGHKIIYFDIVVLVHLYYSPSRVSYTSLGAAMTTGPTVRNLRSFADRLKYLTGLQYIRKDQQGKRSYYSITAKGHALLIRFDSLLTRDQ